MVPPWCAYEWLEESVSHVAACLAHRVGVTILVDSMIPYTRGILRDYGLTSLVTGIKALGMYETGDLATSKRGV